MRKTFLFQARECLEKILLLKRCPTKMQKGTKNDSIHCVHTALHLSFIMFIHANLILISWCTCGRVCAVVCDRVWFGLFVRRLFQWRIILQSLPVVTWTVEECDITISLLACSFLCNRVYCNSSRRQKRKGLWWIFKHTFKCEWIFSLSYSVSSSKPVSYF